MKTIIYIDGFNFYYGAVKNTACKWLDFHALASKLLAPHHQITGIKYFTAKVSGRGDPQRPQRQDSYLRALSAHIPVLSIHLGHFLTHEVSMPLVTPVNGQRMVKVWKTEEKGSDVNLAAHIVNDAWANACDCIVLLSNDSDIAEALRLARLQGKTVGVMCPTRAAHPSAELIRHAHFVKRIRSAVLVNSQLPNPIPRTAIHKPAGW